MGSSSAQEMKTRSPQEWGSQTVGGRCAIAPAIWRIATCWCFASDEFRRSSSPKKWSNSRWACWRSAFRKATTVAVWLPNLPETCVAELAIARIGAAMMAINTRYKASELEYVLRQSDSRALHPDAAVSDAGFSGGAARMSFPNISPPKPGQLNAKATPLLKSLIVLGDAQPGMFTYAEVQQMGRDLLAELHKREEQVTSDDVVLLQYTSGTTAFPKAAMLAHGQVLRNASQMAVRAGIDETDRVLSAMPMFHVGGSVCALLGALTMGYILYMGPVFDAGKTLEAIESEKITDLHRTGIDVYRAAQP